MVLPHHIEEAERIGMPRDKIGLVLQFCRQCDKKLTDNPDKCDECGRETCPKCWYYIPDIGLKFCGKECAITKLLKLLAAAEMNDKPITEHPDVQESERIINSCKKKWLDYIARKETKDE